MILALETATAACSVALCDGDGRVLAEVVALDGPAHAQRLLPGVHEVLAQARAEWADVDIVAAGLGPGAFTGLRIGIATARALAQADGRARLAGVPTTAALALTLAGVAPPAATLVPLVDGKRREVFVAAYLADETYGVRVAEEARVLALADVPAWLAGLDAPVVGGDGVALVAGGLPAGVIDAGVAAPTAAMVGRAVALGVPGVVFGPDAVLPHYGRAPDADRWRGPARSETAGDGPDGVAQAAPAGSPPREASR